MAEPSLIRCAIYTRKSTEDGLDQAFNSLDAQREACGAYVLSQRHEGWTLLPDAYDDGGYSGGSMERPGLKRLLAEVEAGRVDVIVVYKVDRLTRSLADFAKIVEVLDAKGASFVSVTQAFNTTTSMGRLTLNVLLSFAQFEREVTGERIRDKIAASKKKGLWMGGPVPLGYNVIDRKLIVNDAEAATVRFLFQRYLELGSATRLLIELDEAGIRSKQRISRSGRQCGGQRIRRGALYALLRNRLYVGEVVHKDRTYPGQHAALIDRETFDAVGALLTSQCRNNHALDRGVPDPSLLAGLLRDGHGRRMSPSHAVKTSRRYRYYVSQADSVEVQHQPRWRISAPDLEQRVLTLLQDTIRKASQMAIESALAGNIPRLQTAADAACADLSGLPRDQRERLRALVTGITLSTDSITVTGSLASIDPLLGSEHGSWQASLLAVRTGQQTRLIIPPADDSAAPRPNPALVKLITQAMTARAVLEAEPAATFADLAARMGYGHEHAADLLRMSYLAPEIITAILAGTEPKSLTRTKLIRWPALPLAWHQQRKVLGFA